MSPTTPQNDAGWRMDPPVSVPNAAGTAAAATTAADPPELPPGTSDGPSTGLQGFRTGPHRLVSLDDPIANSSMLVLPTRMAPASHNLALTVDSYSGTNPSRIREQAVVATPSVQKMSLTATGIPSRERASSRLRRWSACTAAARARSAVSVTTAFRSRAASCAAIHASTSSTAEQSPAASRSAASATPSRARSEGTAIR